MQAVRKCAFAALVTVLVSWTPVHPKEITRPITVGEVVTLEAPVLGENRDLMVYLPPAYAEGEELYPVLYLLDAEASLSYVSGVVAFLAEIDRIPDLIIVGIPNTDRARDLTPVPGEAERKRFPTSGGADRFRRFLGDQVVPLVEQRYSAAPYRVLVGHSLGGLFAVHTMLNEPELFDAFVVSSPSLYWNGQQELSSAERLLAAERPPGSFFMVMGNEREEMVEGARSFAEGLERFAPSNLEWTFQLLMEEDHSTTPFVAAYRGLQSIFREFHDPEAIGERGFEDYRAGLKAKYGFHVKLPLQFLHGAVGIYADNQRFGDAVDVLEFMGAQYPDAFKAEAASYVLHARGLLTEGQLPLAERLLQLVVSSDPGIADAHEALGDLRVRQDSDEAALQSYRAALELKPGDPDLQRKISELE